MHRILQFALAASLTITSASTLAGGDAAAGKTKSQACAACHGANGVSPTAQFPILAGQYANYMIQTLKDYKSGERNNPIMKGMVASLSDNDMEDLAAFYASQSGLSNPRISSPN